jgi:hypothetical protein
MAPLLTTLPNELFQEIASLLLLPDQAALGRTCKQLNQLLTPTIWSDVELHHRGTHEGMDVDHEMDSWARQDPEERLEMALADEPGYPYKKLVLEPSRRKYSQIEFDPVQWAKRAKLRTARTYTRYEINITNDYSQCGREKLLLNVRKFTSNTRWDFLAQLVQSLCISVGVNNKVVEMIASFSNLRNLELTGYPLHKGDQATAAAPDLYLPRLEFLKLRGYLSGALARRFCGSNAEHITHLNLGLLATTTDDAAYTGTLLKINDENSALVSDEEAESYLQNGAEAAATLAPKAEDGSDDADTGEEEDEDDENDEEQQPWSLHSPIWLPRWLSQRFATLTHLHLVKPYTGESQWMFVHDGYIDIPHRYEQILNKEWVFLLQAVAGTLKELILEHRLPMLVGDTIGDSDPIPEEKRSSDAAALPDWDRGSDRGDEIFCQSVLRFLLEESNSFSRLGQLSFRGIQVKGLPTRQDNADDEVPGRNGVLDNDELLSRAFPNCNIDIFEPAYPIHVYSGQTFQQRPEEGQEAGQDEGDGLLHDASFYNDYINRDDNGLAKSRCFLAVRNRCVSGLTNWKLAQAYLGRFSNAVPLIPLRVIKALNLVGPL